MLHLIFQTSLQRDECQCFRQYYCSKTERESILITIVHPALGTQTIRASEKLRMDTGKNRHRSPAYLQEKVENGIHFTMIETVDFIPLNFKNSIE